MAAEKVIIVMDDGSTVESEDFTVVVDGKEDISDTRLMYNCDVILLGQAVQMLANAYHRDMATLPEEQRKEIAEALANFLSAVEKED